MTDSVSVSLSVFQPRPHAGFSSTPIVVAKEKEYKMFSVSYLVQANVSLQGLLFVLPSFTGLHVGLFYFFPPVFFIVYALSLFSSFS